MALTEKRLSAFWYYGGKSSKLKWLSPLLPPSEYYCESFGGSAAVLLNRKSCLIETYNDLDSEVVAFFRVLRDQPKEFIRQLILTPYSRDEFRIAISETNGCSDIERARRFYIRIQQGFGAKNKVMSQGDWASLKGKTSFLLIPHFYSKAENGDLIKIAHRLRKVQIENRPALEVIKLYDHKKTLHYIDPPYDSDSCDSGYKHRFGQEDYKQLASLLETVDGRVAVSGYNSDLMTTLFKNWKKTEIPSRVTVNNGNEKSRKRVRTEVLFTTYDPYQKRRLF